jgi:hypothetical protein
LSADWVLTKSVFIPIRRENVEPRCAQSGICEPRDKAGKGIWELAEGTVEEDVVDFWLGIKAGDAPQGENLGLARRASLSQNISY